MTSSQPDPDDEAARAELSRLLAESPANLPKSLLRWLEISSPQRIALCVFVVLLAAGLTWLVPEDAALDVAGRRSLFILLLAAGLWLSEAIPAFAVGILIIALQVLLLDRPGGTLAEGPGDWEAHVLVLGHPLVWLFFGGLVLAAGMSRTGIDRWLASNLLERFASRPATLIAGVAGIAFVLSMLMSNTATTAMMLALVTPVVSRLERGDPMALTLVLAIPVGANLGGMGSLVGTPPNAVAAGALASQAGIEINFAQWLVVGLVPGLLLLGLLLGVLLWRVRGAQAPPAELWAGLDADDAQHIPLWERLTVILTLLLTVTLWLTSGVHGLPAPAVSVVPVVILTASGILDVEAFRRLPYDVLFLLAGGLALGAAVHETGLAAWLISGLPAEDVPLFLLALAAGAAAVLLSNIMSNTAAANVLVPLAISAAPGASLVVALPVALCASAAMAMPVSTPPNALAFATGLCRARDFLVLGSVTALAAPPLAAAWTLYVVRPLLG